MGRKQKYTQEELIKIMQSLKKKNLSKIDIDNCTDIGSMTVVRYFGSWSNALRAAGLEEGKITGRPKKYKNSFIDKQSWKCLLGLRAVVLEENELYALWMVGNKRHVVLFSTLNKKNINKLKIQCPFSFHYFSEQDVEMLRTKYKIDAYRSKSTFINLKECFNPIGKKNRGLRNKINRINKMNIEVVENFKDIKDVEVFIKEWRDNYSDKYFRDHSGKSFQYYKNNHHVGNINCFCYCDEKLVAIGTVSKPEGGICSYVIGKALYKKIPLLSEFLDYNLYNRAFDAGGRKIHLGVSFTKDLLKYKNKFTGSENFYEFFGKIEGVKNEI
jgi:hypothetical protein